jgi:hypothetical protein
MKKDFCIISYASGEPYLSESKNLKNLCVNNNLNFKLYDSKWLKQTDFYKNNIKLLSQKKSGYCAWKPYIILDALKYYKKVLYLDSSMLFDAEHLKEYMDLPGYLKTTETPLQCKFYTKHKTFEIMKCDKEKYWNANQGWAGTILVNQRANKFLSEWLCYCQIEDCISDEYNDLEEPNVRYCLFDQGIFSILIRKYNIKLLQDAQDGYAYFYDTREPGHSVEIARKFGREIIDNQLNLGDKFERKYKTSGGVFICTAMLKSA